jgi:hypothetical protein
MLQYSELWRFSLVCVCWKTNDRWYQTVTTMFFSLHPYMQCNLVLVCLPLAATTRWCKHHLSEIMIFWFHPCPSGVLWYNDFLAPSRPSLAFTAYVGELVTIFLVSSYDHHGFLLRHPGDEVEGYQIVSWGRFLGHGGLNGLRFPPYVLGDSDSRGYSKPWS